MEGRGSFFILLVIVAFLTLALAVLAGYIFFVAGTPETKIEYVSTDGPIRPNDEEIAMLKLYEEKEYFNLKNDDPNKIAVIRVNLELVYYKKAGSIKDVAAKLTTYNGEIKEIVGTYFQNLTLDEVKRPETKETAKKDLTKKINELLVATEKDKKDVLYTINFEDWFYQ